MKLTALPFCPALALVLITAAHAQNLVAQPSSLSGKDVSVQIDQLKSVANQPGAKAAAWLNLGNALMQKSREKVGHDFSEPGAAYTKALELQPDLLDALVGMAWVKNSEHDFVSGKEWAGKALAIDPVSVDAHSLIGDGAVELGNYDEAFDAYQAALDVRSDLSSLSRAAHLVWITGNVTKATELMGKAIASGGPYPENVAWCRSELALMHFQSGALLPAEQQATKALEAAPENPRVLATMARVIAAKKDYPHAIELYEKSVSITPNHDALSALVDLYEITGQADKAKLQYDRVIAFHKTDFPAQTNSQALPHFHPPGNAQLARFYADHGKNSHEALKEALAAYSLYKNVMAADTLAWCLCQAGKPEEARKMMAKAMKWKTPDAEIYFHAGMIEEALKQPDAAKRYFSKALSLNPNFNPIRAKLAAELLAKPSQVAAR